MKPLHNYVDLILTDSDVEFSDFIHSKNLNVGKNPMMTIEHQKLTASIIEN